MKLRPRVTRRRLSFGRRLKRLFWWTVAAVVTLHLALPQVRHALHLASVRLTLGLVAGVLVAYATARLVRALRTWAKIRELNVDDQRGAYLIDAADYRRGSPKEHAYRRVMHLTLLATFDNRCAKCGARDDGVDLDHFFLPKNEGGCFIMRHADGYLVNNAIPLCVGCNRSKSDRSYRAFFTRAELVGVLTKNAAMTLMLNQKSPLDRAGQPHRRIRPDRAA